MEAKANLQEKEPIMANQTFYKVVFGITMGIITGGYITTLVRMHRSSKEADKIYQDAMKRLANLR